VVNTVIIKPRKAAPPIKIDSKTKPIKTMDKLSDKAMFLSTVDKLITIRKTRQDDNHSQYKILGDNFLRQNPVFFVFFTTSISPQKRHFLAPSIINSLQNGQATRLGLVLLLDFCFDFAACFDFVTIYKFYHDIR
jgi:hypothetical protein